MTVPDPENPPTAPELPTGSPVTNAATEPGPQATPAPLGPPADPARLKKLEIAARRLTVGQLYLARIGQDSIASQLNVDQATISRDIAWLKKKWLNEATLDVGAYLARELAELDEMERQAALAFGQHLGGHPRWLEVRLKIKERKAAILGLNKSIIELRGSKDSPLEINIEEIRRKRWSQVQEALRDALGPLGDQEAVTESNPMQADDESEQPTANDLSS